MCAFRFARTPADSDLQDANEFLDGFEQEHPEWNDALAAARQSLSKSEIAQQRLPSLARLRLAAGLSQAELARRIGTSQSHIARIESGDGDPQLSTMLRLSEAIGVPLGDLATLLTVRG